MGGVALAQPASRRSVMPKQCMGKGDDAFLFVRVKNAMSAAKIEGVLAVSAVSAVSTTVSGHVVARLAVPDSPINRAFNQDIQRGPTGLFCCSWRFRSLWCALGPHRPQ